MPTRARHAARGGESCAGVSRGRSSGTHTREGPNAERQPPRCVRETKQTPPRGLRCPDGPRGLPAARGAGGAPLRALCRRRQRVCAVERRRRARAGLAGTLALAATPAADESGHERRRTAVEASLPRLQCDGRPCRTPPRGARSRASAEDDAAAGAAPRARPTPCRHRAGPQPHSARLGGVFPAGRSQGEF